MAVAFPIGVGLALVLGVISNYLGYAGRNPVSAVRGCGLCGGRHPAFRRVVQPTARAGAADDGKGHRHLGRRGITHGVLLSLRRCLNVGRLHRPGAGKLGPYTAIVAFAVGLLASNFLWNTLVMMRPFVGEPVPFGITSQGDVRLHLIGMLGGAIWNLGMSLSIIAAGAAGFAISYGLGQGATLVAALWGVFIWKEFRSAPAGTSPLLALMFGAFVVGLTLIVASRFA